jgi:hypothetical protein
MSRKPDLRMEMPLVTAFIDSMREAFGKEMIDAQIRKGLKGSPAFHATENGHEIGTRDSKAKSLVMWDDRGVSFSVDIPADTTAEQEKKMVQDARAMANARGKYGSV